MLKNFETIVFLKKSEILLFYNSGKWKPREYIEFMKENETEGPFENC